MRSYVTYHPAALLHAGKRGDQGPSQETILRCLREDLTRIAKATEVLVPPPIRVPLRGTTSTLGVDLEYKGDKVLTIGVSTQDSSYSWDVGVDTGSGLVSPEPLRDILEGTKVLVGHNLPGDIRLLWQNNILPHREEYADGSALVDTLLVARMAYEGWPSYKLENLLAAFHPVEGWKFETQVSDDPEEWTPEYRAERCRLDAWAPLVIAEHEWGKVGSKQLYVFTSNVAMVLHRLSCAGAFLDRHDFEEVKKNTLREHAEITDKLVKAAALVGMTSFSPTNDHHLRELLYDRLGLPVLDRTLKTKEPSVTKPVLRLLAEQTEGGARGLVEALLQFSVVDKIRTTYVEGVEGLTTASELRGKGGTATSPSKGFLDGFPVLWLPFNFNTLGAKTGRRSSSHPNAQNWPKGIQRLVRSRWVGGNILSCDYKKLEPVVIAWLAKSQKLLDFFTKGGGYVDVARELFHTEIKEGTVLYRGVKSIVLGVHYNMGDEYMAEQLWQQDIRFSADWEEHSAITARVKDAYLRAFPEIAAYMDRREQELMATGQVRTPMGRVRRLGAATSKHIKNQAINFPVQSTASDVTGSALVDVERALLAEWKISLVDWYDILLCHRKKFCTSGYGSGIIGVEYEIPTQFNEVHDSLLVDIPPSHEKRGVELIVETMRSVPTLRTLCPFFRDMPLDVDVKFGERWGG